MGASQSDASGRVSEGVTLTLIPKGGMFLSGVSSFEEVHKQVESSLKGEQSVFTWGGSVAFGARNGPLNLRLTGLKTTGSVVSTTKGIESKSRATGIQMMAFTGDLVIRPLPRFLIQPYGIGGAGTRRLSFRESTGSNHEPKWDKVAQVGAGVDLRLGNLTIGIEAVDYLTGLTDSNQRMRHDAFLFITLGVPVF